MRSYADDKMCINFITHKQILIIYNEVLIVNISYFIN